jgi:lambda family phage minor tail protein L
MSAIHQEAIKLNPDALIALYRLDMTPVGGEVLDFTTEGRAGQPIRFGGKPFTSVPVEFSGMTISGTGSLQTPTMTVANTDGLVQELVNSLGNLEGCKITRWRTFARCLDDGASPDASSFYGPDVYLIDRKSSDTPERIQWELSALIDGQGVYIGRTVIRDTCMWRYREFNQATGKFEYANATCPYAGDKYFDKDNNPVSSPEKDAPARNLTCCRVRFGDRAPLPFGGFPGIVRGLR